MITVPNGYKQTEVGVIPEVWEVIQLKNEITLVNGRGFKPYEWSNTGFPIIRIQNLNGSSDFNYFRGIFDPKILVKTGQILFAWSGSRGTSFGPHIWKKTDGVLNYHTWKVVIKRGSYDDNFLFVLLKGLTKEIEDSAHGAAALVHVQKWEIELRKLPLPPLPEQKAIAQVLSDTDALIEALDQLLAKKKAVKQGAMQELLTGKRRLPGFARSSGYKQTEVGLIPEDWEVKKVREFTIVTSGGTPSTQRPDFWGGEIPWMNSGELNLKKVKSVAGRITKIGLENSATKIIPPNCVLVGLAGQGKTRGTVAINEIVLSTNQSIGAIHPNLTTDAFFLFYFLETKYEYLRLISSGDGGRGGLNLFILGNLEIPLPSLSEQSAIAQLLSDMDDEIQALETKREKYAQIKQGMMEQLLTGKVRLV